MDTFTLGYRRKEGSTTIVPFTKPTHSLVLQWLNGFKPSPQLLDTDEAWRSWRVGGSCPNGHGRIFPSDIDRYLVEMAKRGAKDMARTREMVAEYPARMMAKEILDRCGSLVMALMDEETFCVEPIPSAQCGNGKRVEAYCRIEMLVNTAGHKTSFRIHVPGLCDHWYMLAWGNELIADELRAEIATQAIVLLQQNETTV